MLYRNKKSVVNSWKIIYNKFEGLQKRAVELVNEEAGKYLIRSEGVHTLYVLPCEREGAEIPQNAFIIGRYDESPLIRSLVDMQEIPQNGYLYKVMEKPQDKNLRYVVFTAFDDINVYYAACSYFDEYAYENAPIHGGLPFPEGIYESIAPEYEVNQGKRMPAVSRGGKATTKYRSVFTWGHTINDYRKYVKNLSRLKVNQIILWNEFVPINVKEIIDYAHSFGIEVLNGFAWGWSESRTDMESVDRNALKELKEKVIEVYEREYAHLGADGIYFQSFTELTASSINGMLVATAVTTFVNETVEELYKRYPDLQIQFGLHATSVKNNLEEIAKVDKRVAIIWEDGGAFPFAYVPEIKSEEEFENTIAFMKKLIHLRGDAPMGLMLKGFLTIDWERFANQAGPFILGENHKSVSKFDEELTRGRWRSFSSAWLKYGAYARKFIETAKAEGGEEVIFSFAEKFTDDVYFPEALCTEMFFDCNGEFSSFVKAAAQRDYVKFE